MVHLMLFMMVFIKMFQYTQLGDDVTADLSSGEYDTRYRDMMDLRGGFRSMKQWMALNASVSVFKVGGCNHVPGCPCICMYGASLQG